MQTTGRTLPPLKKEPPVNDECNCQHCGKDLVAHHHRNLRCPNGKTIFREAIKSSLSDCEILQSFDARLWAQEFVKHVTANPSIATDLGCMTGWFANSLMRGYDEHYWRSAEYKRRVRRVLVPWWKRFFVPLEKFGH
jgi:hypothetical protein